MFGRKIASVLAMLTLIETSCAKKDDSTAAPSPLVPASDPQPFTLGTWVTECLEGDKIWDKATTVIDSATITFSNEYFIDKECSKPDESKTTSTTKLYYKSVEAIPGTENAYGYYASQSPVFTGQVVHWAVKFEATTMQGGIYFGDVLDWQPVISTKK